MTKYIYDKATGKVVEKPEKKREVFELPLNPPPIWFIEIYEKYLEEVRNGGPR